MGQKDLCHDCLDGTPTEGCAQDERGSGNGKRNESGSHDPAPEHRIQGSDEADNPAAARFQDRIQHVCDRRLFAQGDKRHTWNKRDYIKDAAEQGKTLAAEQDKGN